MALTEPGAHLLARLVGQQISGSASLHRPGTLWPTLDVGAGDLN